MRISIIGAGPAGALAAVRLARAGACVSLFDPTHPREKPCGGGLTGRALALVSDVIDIRALEAVVVRAATVESPSRTTAEVALNARGATADSSLIVVSRAAFDRALVDAAVLAGAHLITEKVTDVFSRGANMVVRTAHREHDAEYLLGADGVNSLVRRKLATPFTRAQLSIAAGFFVHGASASTIAIKSMAEQPGYLWSFPRHDHLAVGICTPAAHGVTSQELRAQSRSWIEENGLHHDSTLRPYAWPIPSVGFEDALCMTSSGPGWMLLGDAAGLVDPLTREGIYYALLSGQWAAEALAGGSALGATALYAERLRAELQPELARAARLSALFFSPRFSTLFVGALRESGAIREVFVDLVAGAQPYRGLGRRLLSTREWTLAGRAIRLALIPAFTGTIKTAVSPQAT
ncbi:MAG TPA: geranylgeranyl reductase family protein [Vicinamibacterales bacterium]|nr:geranylgeranyl reductase family protein [Vicinamibacterales bacterium]